MPQLSYFRRLQEFSTAIRLVRAPLLLAALSYVLLSTPAQILELYLLLARNWERYWPQALLGLISLGALSLFIAFVSRGLLAVSEDVKQGRETTIIRVLPGILGMVPLLGAAIGLYTALQSTLTEPLLRSMAVFDAVKTEQNLRETVKAITSIPNVDAQIQQLFPDGNGPRDQRPDDEDLVKIGNVIREVLPQVILDLPKKAESLKVSIYSASALCVLFAIVLFAFFLRQPTAVGPRSSVRRLFHPAVFAVFIVAFLLLTTVFAAQSIKAVRDAGYDFTAVPRALGTLTLVNLSLIFLVFFSSVLTRIADRIRVPLVAPLIAIAFLSSFHDLNDNHAVRIERLPANDKRLSLQDAFKAWFASRPAEYRAKFEGKPYPVYVVAAQGGGIYAANLAGLFLAHLYDKCPLIRHHVFAISGVSGGSIGAGFFAALLNESSETKLADTCDPDLPPSGTPHAKGPLQTKMERLLQTDFLAPVAASLLFPDLLQRFLPIPIPVFDRARAFEAGLESAWDGPVNSKSNPLRQPFSRHWRPNGDSPILLLNATIAETGRQIAFSPIELVPLGTDASPELQSFQTMLRIREPLDMPLSTAMSLSARFPVVMPAGLMRSENQSFHLVDGGYSENTAIESSLALIDKLRTTVCADLGAKCETSSLPFHFKVFPLTDSDPTPDYHANQRHSEGGLNEILSPVRAMYNARIARGDLTVAHVAKDNSTWAGSVLLNHRIYKLPLGWQLSPQVQDIISAQVAVIDCSFADNFSQFMAAVDTTTIWLDAGLEIVEARKKLRKARDYFGNPLGAMLTNLWISHCTVLQMLANDKVWMPPQ
jgi:hypothetical protein